MMKKEKKLYNQIIKRVDFHQTNNI
jgi:hypothetical protein